MLFSEPKIPQCVLVFDERDFSIRFSALQRAENSSIADRAVALAFFASFSALQRAENSSMEPDRVETTTLPLAFQCSSASRKFLNSAFQAEKITAAACFSALQRAENSSIH